MRTRNGFAHNVRGFHARLEYVAPIARGVAAVHAAANEIDHDIRAVDLAGPRAEGVCIPAQRSPRR